MRRVAGRVWLARFLVLALTFAAIEGTLRLLSVPGTADEPKRLLGRPLPPFDLLMGLQLEPTRFDEPAPERLQRGDNLTRGDLWGISRQDAELGHVPLESARSLRGWWQSNTLGARDREETAPQIPRGRTRVLAFGDSYTHGSRVPQDATWPAWLEAMEPSLDVVNFGVDGYGMAQSFLRYRSLRDRVRYDGVALVFVPGADLPRDVNVFRPLLDWAAPISVPRFSVDGRCVGAAMDASGMHRIVPYYDSVDAFAAANQGALDSDFRAHLRCHDLHYRRTAYDSLPIIGDAYIVRLAAAVGDSWQSRSLAASMMAPRSDAVRLSGRIFAAMSSEVQDDGARFLLAYLPLIDEIERGRSDPDFRAQWSTMMEATCPLGASCLDLLPGLAAAPPEAIDEGRGSHYGTRTNRRIARAIGDEIARLAWPRSASVDGGPTSSSTE